MFSIMYTKRHGHVRKRLPVTPDERLAIEEKLKTQMAAMTEEALDSFHRVGIDPEEDLKKSLANWDTISLHRIDLKKMADRVGGVHSGQECNLCGKPFSLKDPPTAIIGLIYVGTLFEEGEGPGDLYICNACTRRPDWTKIYTIYNSALFGLAGGTA